MNIKKMVELAEMTPRVVYADGVRGRHPVKLGENGYYAIIQGEEIPVQPDSQGCFHMKK